MLRDMYVVKDLHLSNIASGDSGAKTSAVVFCPYKTRLKEVWISVGTAHTARGNSNVNLILKTGAGVTVGTALLATTASGGVGDIAAGVYEDITSQFTVNTEIASNSTLGVTATTNGNGQAVALPSLAIILEPIGAE